MKNATPMKKLRTLVLGHLAGIARAVADAIEAADGAPDTEARPVFAVRDDAGELPQPLQVDQDALRTYLLELARLTPSSPPLATMRDDEKVSLSAPVGTDERPIRTVTMSVGEYLSDPAAARLLSEEAGRVVVVDALGQRRLTVSSERASAVLLSPEDLLQSPAEENKATPCVVCGALVEDCRLGKSCQRCWDKAKEGPLASESEPPAAEATPEPAPPAEDQPAPGAGAAVPAVAAPCPRLVSPCARPTRPDVVLAPAEIERQIYQLRDQAEKKARIDMEAWWKKQRNVEARLIGGGPRKATGGDPMRPLAMVPPALKRNGKDLLLSLSVDSAMHRGLFERQDPIAAKSAAGRGFVPFPAAFMDSRKVDGVWPTATPRQPAMLEMMIQSREAAEQTLRQNDAWERERVQAEERRQLERAEQQRIEDLQAADRASFELQLQAAAEDHG